MNNYNFNNKLLFLFFLSFLTYIFSLFLTLYDKNFNYRWFSFLLYIISVSLIPLYFIFKNNLIKKINFYFLKNTFKKNKAFVLLIFLTIISRFIFLKIYPFVPNGDELRDCGLWGYRILKGEVLNLNGWGPYEAFGNIIPTIGGFFYKIFKNSVFTFRLPAAIFSVLDIFLIYFLSNKVSNLLVAFFSSLLIINSSLHLYNSRTELVVILNSFITTYLITLLYIFLEKPSPLNFLMIGISAGVATGMHATLRIIIFSLIFFVCLYFLSELKSKKDIKLTIIKCTLFLISYFIGFGAKIIFTPPEVFFHFKRVPLLSQEKNVSFYFLINNYLKSLSVYIHEPVNFWGRFFFGPLLPFPLFFFFIIGFIYALFAPKKLFLKILLFYLLIIPFFNSTITDIINSGHRLIPLVPISAIITALGINLVFIKIKKFLRKNLFQFLFIILFLVISSRGLLFFINETATLSVKDPTFSFLSMHLIYFLKNHPEIKNPCFISSLENRLIFNDLGVNERFQFFLPNLKYFLAENNLLKNNQIVVSKNCFYNSKYNYLTIKYCQKRKKYLCPLNNEPLELLIDKNYLKNPEI